MALPSLAEQDAAAAVTSARSIKSCLDYLYRQAVSENFLLTAHLIGAAAESLTLHGDRTEPTSAPEGNRQAG